jgi:predicted dehydrogenase
MTDKKIAMIGLDTSHTVEFTKLIQDTESGHKIIDGMRVTKALRFPSAFQPEEGQDQRQTDLENLGVTMAPSIDEVVKDVDAVFLEINDPALHLEYFEAVADRGLPVFIDKPLAANTNEGKKIQELATKNNIPVWSSSSLRFIPELIKARETITKPLVGHTFGALGAAAAGSDLVWYGVHAVEMLVAGLGTGVESVTATEDSRGIILIVNYKDERRGIVECLRGLYKYGGRIQSEQEIAYFDSGIGSPYNALMNALHDFVCNSKLPVPLSEAQEVLAILEAGEKSLTSKKTEKISM